MASGSTARLYSLDEVIADMDGMMAIPGPGLEDEDWSDDEFEGYVDDEQQQGEGENVVTTEELEIGGEHDTQSIHGPHTVITDTQSTTHNLSNTMRQTLIYHTARDL